MLVVLVDLQYIHQLYLGAGISITGPGATKTLGIHYGGQNDNTLRFGRYAKAAKVSLKLVNMKQIQS